MKELIGDIFAKLKDFASRIDKTEVKLEGVIKDFTPFDPTELEKDIHAVKEDVNNLDLNITYDDSELMKALDELKATIPEAFDSSELEAKYVAVVDNMVALNDKVVEVEKSIPEIPEAFDPSKLEAKIDAVEKSIPEIPAPYDDMNVKSMMRVLRDDMNVIRDNTPEIPKEYDDTELQKQINGIKGLLEKEVSEIKKAIDAPIKVEASTTKHYDGEVTAKGDMVLHENNLYVNLLDANDSVPSDLNKSYKLLIKAPKAPVHKGLYKEDDKYEQNDMVMWDNASWIKTFNENQTLPSEGWKLMAKAVRGKPGKHGEKGDTGIVDYDNAIQDLHDEVAILKAKVKGYEDAITED